MMRGKSNHGTSIRTLRQILSKISEIKAPCVLKWWEESILFKMFANAWWTMYIYMVYHAFANILNKTCTSECFSKQCSCWNDRKKYMHGASIPGMLDKICMRANVPVRLLMMARCEESLRCICHYQDRGCSGLVDQSKGNFDTQRWMRCHINDRLCTHNWFN